MTLEEYCNDCPKLKEGGCIYPDAGKKVGANRGFSLGCAFSGRGSRVLLVEEKPKTRIGQQKSKKKSKQVSWRTYKSKNSTKLSRMKGNASKA